MFAQLVTRVLAGALGGFALSIGTGLRLPHRTTDHTIDYGFIVDVVSGICGGLVSAYVGTHFDPAVSTHLLRAIAWAVAGGWAGRHTLDRFVAWIDKHKEQGFG